MAQVAMLPRSPIALLVVVLFCGALAQETSQVCSGIGEHCGDNTICGGMDSVCGANSVCAGMGTVCGPNSKCYGINSRCGPGSVCTGIGAQCDSEGVSSSEGGAQSDDTDRGGAASSSTSPQTSSEAPPAPQAFEIDNDGCVFGDQCQGMNSIGQVGDTTYCCPAGCASCSTSSSQTGSRVKTTCQCTPQAGAMSELLAAPAPKMAEQGSPAIHNQGCTFGDECQGAASVGQVGEVTYCCPPGTSSLSMSSSQTDLALTTTCACSAAVEAQTQTEELVATAPQTNVKLEVQNQGCAFGDQCNEAESVGQVNDVTYCCPPGSTSSSMSTSQTDASLTTTCVCTPIAVEAQTEELSAMGPAAPVNTPASPRDDDGGSPAIHNDGCLFGDQCDGAANIGQVNDVTYCCPSSCPSCSMSASQSGSVMTTECQCMVGRLFLKKPMDGQGLKLVGVVSGVGLAVLVTLLVGTFVLARAAPRNAYSTVNTPFAALG